MSYDDGDVDEALLPSCVRPFRPYMTNELVEVRVGESDYSRGIVIRVYEGDLYDIQTKEGHFVSKISPGDMRRFSPLKNLKVGSVVEAQFSGGDEWFPGQIVDVGNDGTYAVQYDDGDYEPRVLAKFIH